MEKRERDVAVVREFGKFLGNFLVFFRLIGGGVRC